MALTGSSRSSTAECLRQQNAKGRTRVTLTTSRLRAGSANTSAKQRLKRRPDRTLDEVVAGTTGSVPKTFKSRLYDTPSARQEAEEAERLRWLQALALLVERSPTAMGNLLARQPGSLALLGAGRRAAATHEVFYLTSLEHFVGFLRARASEPANRGALRNVNRTFTFLHEVTGTEQVNRLTATPLYDEVYGEILASCEPGRPVKQAPRFPVVFWLSLRTS